MTSHHSMLAALVALVALVAPLALAGLPALAATPAQAQVPGPGPALADPTRPGPLAAPAPAPQRRSDPAAPAAAPAAPAWPQLQSVQIAAQGGSTALVDGRVLRVGDRIGELSVAAIDAQGISLRGARFEQRLALLPGVLKVASHQTPQAPGQAVAVAAPAPAPAPAPALATARQLR